MIRDEEGRISRFERGDVVWGIDPFNRDFDGAEQGGATDGSDGIAPRPWLVLSTDAVPFHPEQYLCVSLTSRTWHDETIPILASDWAVGGAPAATSVMPWSVAAIKHELLVLTGELTPGLDLPAVDELPNGFQGRLKLPVVDEVTRRLVGYLKGTIGSEST